jgi:hypothetical protein
MSTRKATTAAPAAVARDPFSPEADPGRDEQETLRLSRRTLMVAAAVTPALAAGCTHPRLACPTLPDDAERCTHRFCRYHHG